MQNIKSGSFLFFSLIVYALFWYMTYRIIQLEHRVSVLEDQMETTMNLTTDDGRLTYHSEGD